MERFQHNINNRLLVSIDKLDNSKIIGLIESKHKLLKSPKELHNLFKKLLGFTVTKKALAKNTEGALKLVQSMPVRIEGYENIEHELLVAAQNRNRDRAISLYREYVNKEGSIVRYYKYAKIVAKRSKKAGKMLEEKLKSASKRRFLTTDIKRVAYASVACYVLTKVDPFGVFLRDAPAGGLPQSEVEEAPMNKVPGLDYVFDGGVYTDVKVIRSKWTGRYTKQLKRSDKDLHFLYDVPELYEAIGKHIEPLKDNVIKLGFNDSELEVGITFKVGNSYYAGFTTVDKRIHELMNKYNKT